MYKRSVKITRIKKDESVQMEDSVLIESPIDISINSIDLVNIICLPRDLKELAIGFLYSIGIINTIDDVKEIQVDELDNKIAVTLNENLDFNSEDLEINPVSRVVETTCGITSPWRAAIKKTLDNAQLTIDPEKKVLLPASLIQKCIVEMQKQTLFFRETGGCHGAAVFTFDGELIAVKEDIGRHNAIDKVIGTLLLERKSFTDKILTSTGRLTGDSVLKAIRARFPVLASVSAAIESGIRLAFAYGITLIGFVRGSRMNVYTYPERIMLKDL